MEGNNVRLNDPLLLFSLLLMALGLLYVLGFSDFVLYKYMFFIGLILYGIKIVRK